MKQIAPALKDQLTKLIAQMGYVFFGHELILRGRHTIFRLYIDSEKGVTIDDCAAVSHQVSALLDVENPFAGHYTLEVSSPGINRPLFEMSHFRKYIGSRVKIKLFSAIQGHKQYKGIVKRIVGDDIYLLADNMTEEVVLPFSMVEKANLIGEVGFQNA